MTVQSQTSRADYTGNGLTTNFPVPFYWLQDSDLLVIRTDNRFKPPTVATLALGTDYVVTGSGNPAGGSITTTVAPTATQKLSILRNVPFTQLTHYVPNDPFPAASHEQALDKLTMETQQLNEGLSRSLTLPPNTTGVSTALPTPVANNFIGWNPTATALQNVDPTTVATSVMYGNAIADKFSGDGSTVNFNLSANPGGINNLDVSVGGVTQRPGIDYTWTTGTTLTFTAAPPAGTNNILVRYTQALPIGSIGVGQVTAANLADGAVTDSVVAPNAGIQATKLAVTATGAGAVARTVADKLGEIVSVKDFGAKGDGVTDDTAAVVAAVAWCISAGRTLWVPAGVYVISSTITVDLTSISPTFSTPGNFFSIAGESKSNTVFLFTGAANVNLFYFKGRFGNFDLLKVEDLRFQRILGAGQNATGMRIDSMAFLSMRRVLFYGWSLGANLNSVLTSKFEECDFMVNTQHIAAAKGAPNQSAPNLIEWDNCRFQAGVHNGVVITGGVSNKFTKCDFEGNGTQGSGDVIVAYNGTPSDGQMVLSFEGCYFENNAGAADVYINHPALDVTYTFRDNEFSRISNTRYTTNNIVIDPGTQGAGAPPARTILEGNAFSEVGTYVSSSSRATVVFGLGSGANYNGHSISDLGNTWPATSAPQFPVQNQNGLMLHGYNVGSASYALPSLAAGAITTTTVGINNSQLGDPVVVSLANLPGGVLCYGQITSPGTALVTFHNVTGSTVGPLSAANLRAAAIKF